MPVAEEPGVAADATAEVAAPPAGATARSSPPNEAKERRLPGTRGPSIAPYSGAMDAAAAKAQAIAEVEAEASTEAARLSTRTDGRAAGWKLSEPMTNASMADWTAAAGAMRLVRRAE